MFVPTIPPELFEVLNTAVAAMCVVVIFYCGFYFVSEFRLMRRGLALTAFEAGAQLLGHRLAIGTAISFLGAGGRAAWVAAGHFLQVAGVNVDGMAELPLVLIPVGFTLVLILGGACVARAIVPRALGAYAYAVTLAAVLVAITATQVFRH